MEDPKVNPEPAPRALLYVPADVPKLLDGAHKRGADAVVLDLEDAVLPERKDEARAALRDAVPRLAATGLRVAVRINSDPRLVLDDLRALLAAGSVWGIVVPKVESPRTLAFLDSYLDAAECPPDSPSVIAVVESARGLRNLDDIADCPGRLYGIALGEADLELALGAHPTGLGTFSSFRQHLALATAAAGIHAFGPAGSIADYRDLESFRRGAEEARSLGFAGGFAVHPDQVRIMNEVFTPTAEAIESAREIVATYNQAVAEGRGVTRLEGLMIDSPVARQAARIVALADALAERAESEAATATNDHAPSLNRAI